MLDPSLVSLMVVSGSGTRLTGIKNFNVLILWF
jgi:hypothetical protein